MRNIFSRSLYTLALAGCGDPADPIAVAELESFGPKIEGRAELFAPNDGDTPYLMANRVELPAKRQYVQSIYDAARCNVVPEDTFLAVALPPVFSGKDTHYKIDVDNAEQLIGKIYVVSEHSTTEGSGAWLACGVLVAQ